MSNLTPARPPSHDPQDQEAFRLGIEQFNAGRFFEAHETWEEVWLRSPEPGKTFLQGIIQITAAFHHHSRGNARGTRSLLEAGLKRLDRSPDAHYGIDVAALRTEARAWVAAMDAGRIPVAEVPLPQIKFTANA